MRNRTIWAGLALLALVLIDQGCNTMDGAGKDVEKTGEAIQRAAD